MYLVDVGDCKVKNLSVQFTHVLQANQTNYVVCYARLSPFARVGGNNYAFLPDA